MLVGKENFCDFQTIQEAINFIETSDYYNDHITLYILEGFYQEQIVIKRSHITLIGLGEVIISHNAYAKQKDNNGDEIGTFATATLYLDGIDVHLENLTIENTSGQGEIVGQAIAVYANCDLSTFRNCRFKGYQDTLFTSCLPDKQKDGTDFPVNRPVHSQYRQYYLNCYIEGTVDYIFGGATAYFDYCILMNKSRNSKKSGYITAASTPYGKEFGFVFNQCIIISEEDARPVYLGRPWRSYANVYFQKCKMDNNIHANRWHDWDNKDNRLSARFEESGTFQTDFSENYSGFWGRREIYTQMETIKPEDVFPEKFY